MNEPSRVDAPPALVVDAARAAFARGRACHPALDLSREAFEERVTSLAARPRVPGSPAPSPAEVAASLGRAAHGDLYLATACEVGVAGAWEEFSSLYRGRLEGLVLARGTRRSEAESLVADLLADLALPPPRGGVRSLLGTYNGSGSLFAWLAVILARRRAAAAARPRALLGSETTEEEPRPSRSLDPADAVADAETAREFGGAFERAWAGLGERERLLLLFKYRNRMRQTDIATLLGIGAPRVSRILDRAVQKLRRAIQGGLPAGGDRLWEALRDAVGRSMARTEGLVAPPREPKGPKSRNAP